MINALCCLVKLCVMMSRYTIGAAHKNMILNFTTEELSLEFNTTHHFIFGPAFILYG